MIKTLNLRKLIPSLLIPIFTGLLAQIFSSNAKEVYSTLKRPPLSPPSIVFPFVWTAIYILLGIALYFVEESKCYKNTPRKIFAVLLVLNVLWPLFFFTLNWYTFSVFIIVLLLISAIVTFVAFYNCEKAAGYFVLPLIIWVIYATYLNIGTAILN